MIDFTPPIISFSLHSKTRSRAVRLVGGISLLIGVVCFAGSCKGDVKSSSDAVTEINSAITASDSLFSQLFVAQQAFHQLKARMESAPESLKSTTAYKSLLERVEGTIIKSGVFFDQISQTKESASAGLSALQSSGDLDKGKMDSTMNAVRKYVADNQETYQVFLKAAEVFTAEYDQLKAGAGN